MARRGWEGVGRSKPGVRWSERGLGVRAGGVEGRGVGRSERVLGGPSGGWKVPRPPPWDLATGIWQLQLPDPVAGSNLGTNSQQSPVAGSHFLI